MQWVDYLCFKAHLKHAEYLLLTLTLSKRHYIVCYYRERNAPVNVNPRPRIIGAYRRHYEAIFWFWTNRTSRSRPWDPGHPQIPAEETIKEGRNVRPGLCPNISKHYTILRIFYLLF